MMEHMADKDDKLTKYIVYYEQTETYKVIIEATDSDTAGDIFHDTYYDDSLLYEEVATHEPEITDVEEYVGSIHD